MAGGEELLVRLAAGGGWTLALAAFFYAARWCLPPLLEFLHKRADAREVRIQQQQERLDKRYDARLAALEKQEADKDQVIEGLVAEKKGDRSRISLLEHIVSVLVGEVRMIDPTNPRLSQVAKMLRGSIPLELGLPPDMTDSLDQLK